MRFVPKQKKETSDGLGGLWDFLNFNISMPIDNSLLDTPNYVDKSVINGANDPNNYFNSAEFKAGIAANYYNGGDTSGTGILNFDKIYAAEKAKYEQEGYKTTQQQQEAKAGKTLLDNHLERTKIEEDYKNGVTNSVTTTNNQSNNLDNTPPKQWFKGLENWQTAGLGFLAIGTVTTVIVVVATPSSKKKK